MRYLPILFLGIAVVVGGCSGRSSYVPQSDSGDARATVTDPATLATQNTLRRSCGSTTPGAFRCTMIAGGAIFHAIGDALTPDNTCTVDKPPCYGPIALRSAYNVTRQALTGGKNTTIAIVDAYGDPTAKGDVALYRKAFHLPALCATCFEVMNQSGGHVLPPSSPSWIGEEALDVDMVSAICPNCRIVLVEASDESDASLFEAVSTALKKATIVSTSWGVDEFARSATLFDKHPGKVIVAASGDTGYILGGAIQPCTFAGVVCVGGTSLLPEKSARGWGETVWSDIDGSSIEAPGSACSAIVHKPAWQHDKGCTMRSATDISADADPNTGVMIALQGKCCYGSVGGTSVATPIVAALYALAGDLKTATPAKLWAHGGTKALNAVTYGDNGTCARKIQYICTAGTHMNGLYSGPTGWGTPHGLLAL